MALVDLALQVLLIVAAPLVVGFSFGLDRRITARMQNRRGPPLLQPFYDVAKLLSKQPMIINDVQVFFAGAALLFQAAAFALFVGGGDLLIAFFVSGTGSVSLALGSFSARSPFSYIGAHRELLTILSYESVLFLVVVAIGLEGSFLVSEAPPDLLVTLPLVLVAMVPVLVILLEKSPFDIATAHQELVSGPFVEYSGPYLALLQVARWFELAFIYGIVTLFVWSDDLVLSLALKLGLAFIVLFATIVIDNVTARLTRESMVSFMLSAGVGLVAVNLLLLFVFGAGGF